MPAIEKDCNVVVPMKENQRFFVYDNEESIEKFREFTQDEELYPKAS